MDVEVDRELSAQLEAAESLSELGLAVLSRAIPAGGADAGVVALLTADGEELEVVASVGYPVEACMGPGRRWAAVASIPIAEAVRTDRPVRIGSPQEWASHYEMGYVPNSRSAAWAAVPLRHAGRSVGALLWTYHAPRTFSDDDLRAMEAYAAAASEGLKRLLD